MASTKTYLVPLDFSKASEAALNHAVKIAKRNKAKLLLLHVISDSALLVSAPEGGTDFFLQLLRGLEENAKRLMKRVVDRKRLRPGQYRSLIVRGGNPAEAIARHAKKARASMIVMGSHGRTGLQRFFLGSVAERTLRYAECPVLIVK